MASRHGRARSYLNMRESKLNGVFFLLALLLVWELAARAQWVNPLIVPAVSKIVATFSELFWSGQIPLQILASLKRAALGYALAAAIFIPLGIFMGLFDNIRRALERHRRNAAANSAPRGYSRGDVIFRIGRRDEDLCHFLFLCLADSAEHPRWS